VLTGITLALNDPGRVNEIIKMIADPKKPIGFFFERNCREDTSFTKFLGKVVRYLPVEN
jgi:hypothetical protein